MTEKATRLKHGCARTLLVPFEKGYGPCLRYIECRRRVGVVRGTYAAFIKVRFRV